MPPMVLYGLVFLAIILAFGSVYSFLADIYLRDRGLISQRLDDEFRMKLHEQAKKSPLFKDLAKLAAELPNGAGAKPSIRQRCQLFLDQSGVKITLMQLLIVAATLGLVLGGAGGLVRKSLLVAAILSVLGIGLPLLYVHWRRRTRITKLLSQLPDAFDLMARVMKVGQTPARAMHAVAEEFDRPIAAEFAFCYEQQNLGLPASVVLRDLALRNGVLELHIFVIAMLIQQQTGGSLAEMMEGLARSEEHTS